MKNFVLFIFTLLFCNGLLLAQKSVTFDQFAFTEPVNWTFADNGSYHTYMNINKTANVFCIISVYTSDASSGNDNEDFSSAWKRVIADHFMVPKNPKPQKRKPVGKIDCLQGEAVISNETGNFYAKLLVFELAGKTQSVLFLSQNQSSLAQYKSDLDKFLFSLKPNTTGNTGISENMNSSQVATSNNNGITIATTNFDDGWTATVKDDYILLTKGIYKVHLCYFEKFNNESRDKTVDYFYAHQLSKEYTITNTVIRSDQWHYYIEGEAMENATGNKCYIAMDVIADNGIAKPVIAISPSQAEHRNQFGTDLKSILTYNRFGVARQDMAGTWKAGSGNSITYYSYSTGDAVGANAVVTSDKFIFNNNGSFQAEFKGAMGMVGNMRTYQQLYKGKFSVLSPWQISTTDQDNKTVVYDCWFQAVKGGTIFHLVDHDHSGNAFDLVKEK